MALRGLDANVPTGRPRTNKLRTQHEPSTPLEEGELEEGELEEGEIEETPAQGTLHVWALDAASLTSGARVLSERDGLALLSRAKIHAVQRLRHARTKGLLQNALFDAARRGDTAAVRLLLAAGVDPEWEVECVTGGTMFAFEGAILAFALTEGDIKLPYSDIKPSAPVGSHDDFEACVRLLMASSAAPAALINRIVDCAPRNAPREPLLHDAARWGRVRTTKLLLELRADPLLRDESREGRTAPEWAEYLLARGVSDSVATDAAAGWSVETWRKYYNSAQNAAIRHLPVAEETKAQWQAKHAGEVQACAAMIRAAAAQREHEAAAGLSIAHDHARARVGHASTTGDEEEAMEAEATEAEAAPSEAERRGAWIEYYVHWNMIDEARMLGWHVGWMPGAD